MTRNECLFCLLVTSMALLGIFWVTHSWLVLVFAVQGILPISMLLVIVISAGIQLWRRGRTWLSHYAHLQNMRLTHLWHEVMLTVALR